MFLQMVYFINVKINQTIQVCLPEVDLLLSASSIMVMFQIGKYKSIEIL